MNTITLFIRKLKGYFFKYRSLTVLLVAVATAQAAYCQYDDEEDVGQPYNEEAYGSLSTERNDPYLFLEIKEDSTPQPCRKLNKKLVIFGSSNEPKDISGFKNKSYSLLTDDEKELIIINVWDEKDQDLIGVVLNIAIYDTAKAQRFNRASAIMCLSLYNSEASKKVLLNLLQLGDKTIKMTSALSLVQIGLANEGFNYIEKNYNSYSDPSQIVTALMIINTRSAVNLLMKMSENKDPSYAIDALGALSLLGYCDFAFKNILKYKDSDIGAVRRRVAACLAYYIGTPAAFDIIKTFKNDGDHLVKEEIIDLLNTYKIK